MIARPIPRSAVIALLAFLMYLPALACQFHSDDFFILHGVLRGGPFGFWSGADGGFFRPLVAASLWLDSAIWGLNPLGYHLTSVLLHAANCALVAALAARLFERFELAPAVRSVGPWIAGLLFAVLPAHVEAVVWLSCRTDLLATLFGLTAAHLAFSERRAAPWLAGAALAVAMLAKESALMLPFFVALIGAGLGAGEARRSALRASGGMLLAACLVVGFRAVMIGGLVGGYGSATHAGSLRGVAGNFGLYLGKTLMPFSIQELALLPSTAPITTWVLTNPRLVAALAALLFLAAVLWLARRRSQIDPRRARFAGVLFLGFFLLALPALPLGMSRYTMEGARFVYLPSVSLCVLLALGLASLRRPLRAIVFVPLLALYGRGLYVTQTPWIVAGDAAKASLDVLRAGAEGQVVLLSVPDSYRGAYCLRNGLKEALEIFAPGKRIEVVQVSSAMWEIPGAVPTLVREAGQVTLITPGGPFLPLQRTPGGEEAAAKAGVRTIRFGPYQAVFEDPEGKARVLTPQEPSVGSRP